jgi:hypothetical protein
MSDHSTEITHRIVVERTAEGTVMARAVTEGFAAGKGPLKIVTGTQETSNLHFELKSGAIVAHAGATVIFVCG